MRRTLLPITIVLSVLALACGGDDDGVTPIDGSADGGGSPDGAPADGGGTTDCTGMPDGTSCGMGSICFAETCVPGRCGDGFVDSTGGEECDDENEIPGDGCEPATCTFSCADDTACDNMFLCDGAETCNTSLHRCQAGTPVDGGMCTRPEDGSDGVCSGGLCASPGCGNSVVDSGEECDDGQNGDNDDGCRDDCTYTCEEDAECQNGDACDGTETCAASSHTCEDAPAADCNDSDPCTADSCDMAMGCVNTAIDGDMDTYSPGTCTTAGIMGGDCNDTNSAIHPGAPELCDMMDNDCDSMVDDSTVTITCYRDADRDTYGIMSDSRMACTCPAGYVPPHPGGFDCLEVGTNATTVNPGNTNWYTRGYCPTGGLCTRGSESYDWNCDGTATRRYNTVSTGSCGFSCSGILCYCAGGGWIGSVPACGTSASYRTCPLSCAGTGTVATRAQECH